VTDPAGPTQEYRGDAPAATRSERVRVALVVGAGTSEGHDLYDLLLRRLRVFASIFAGAFLVFFALLLPLVWRAAQSGRLYEPAVFSEAAQEIILRGVPLLVFGLVGVRLWRRPPSSIAGLRAVELLLVGVVAGLVLLNSVLMYGAYLQHDADELRLLVVRSAVTYMSINSLYWFSLLVMYGALLPNTWRRSAAVVGSLALSPLVVFGVLAFWVRPIRSDLAAIVLANMTFWVGVAVAIAVFSSSRVEYLRRQAAAARKLGQYVLKEKLGSGGMGEVYRADHVLLRRPCAIKVIRPERAGDPAALARFEREVQATATLTHPNTVQVYDYGHAADGTFYYVMEYLPGPTLEELVRREGPLPPSRAVHFLRQLCGALDEAHAIGLIHRDVKPGNVIVCERGRKPDVVKLLDFGLAQPVLTGGKDDRLTREGAILGTPAYLSPEQAAGREGLDGRSDVYSVGALAYFLLTGHPPFAGRSGVALLAAHLHEVPEPPSRLRPDVPADLEAVVLRCLAKKPEDRFAEMTCLDDALAACQLAPRAG